MARVQHPTAGTVVNLEGNLLERYRAVGWADPSAEQVPVLLEKPEEDADADSDDEATPAGSGPDEEAENAIEAVSDEPPRGNASLEDWAAYAMSKGVAGESLNGLKRDEIKQLFAE